MSIAVSVRAGVPSLDRERAILDVMTRLTRRFDGEVPASVVADVVRESAAALVGARVVDFVPLFVERAATQRLRLLVDERTRGACSGSHDVRTSAA